MRIPFLKPGAAAALAATQVFARTPSATRQPDAARWLSFDRQLEHVAHVLGLTDSQKEQARVILRNARESSQPLQQELRQNRERLTAAAKSASEPDIQRLATEQGRLLGQLVAIRTRALAKFYQTLSPEQRVKCDELRQQSRRKFYPRERKNGP
jgi:Spy/CpxP family protein refolding chaperone